MLKVTKDQIQDLYKFTRKHFVEHYDLQTELVDHLANDVELMWELDINLSYENAKKKAFKKFGIFGFMDVVSERQKAMGKRYRVYLCNELKLWFQWPQLLTTLLIFSVFLFVFFSTYAFYLTISIYLVLCFWVCLKTFRLKQQQKKRFEVSQKKWLLEDMIFTQSGITNILVFLQFFQFRDIVNTFQNNSLVIMGFALLFTIIVLLSYISMVVMPNKAEELLKDTYPEYVLL